MFVSVTLAALLLFVPGSSSVKFHFFNNDEALGVSFNVNDKRSDDVTCVITAPVSSRRETVTEISREELNRLKRHCDEVTNDRTKRGDAIINIIAPGTKWCGTGNTASNDNDLGSEAATDACCRTHDKCTPKIDGFSSIGTFINILPYTRLHCDCDNAFHTCLKEASKTEATTANLVGFSYFNLLDTHCFIEHSWSICIKFGWFKCEERKWFNTYKWVATKSF